MNVKRFVLSYYKNAMEDFYITRITSPHDALNLHSHNYFQIYFVLGGNMVHHVEERKANLEAGDLFILPPNLPHFIQVSGREVDFYSLSFTPDFVRDLRESNRMVSDFLYYLNTALPEEIHLGFSFSPADLFFAKTLFERIMEEFSGNQAGKREVIRGSVLLLLSLFARVYFEQQAEVLKSEENQKLVMHCVEYIKRHFDEEITLSEMVRRSAISKTRFCALFTEITGSSFKEYLNQRRIQRAVDLIRAGEKISEVAVRCGYGDFSTFYRNFKKQTNLSPTEWKQNSRQKT